MGALPSAGRSSPWVLGPGPFRGHLPPGFRHAAPGLAPSVEHTAGTTLPSPGPPAGRARLPLVTYRVLTGVPHTGAFSRLPLVSLGVSWP